MSWFWDLFGASDENPYAPEGGHGTDDPAAQNKAAAGLMEQEQPPSSHTDAAWSCTGPPPVDRTAELQLQPWEGFPDDSDIHGVTGGQDGFEAGLAQALPSTNVEVIVPGGDVPVVERDGNRPMAKTAARKRCHALPSWEDADSEEEEEQERRRQEALQKTDWTPFISEEETKKAEEASRKMRREEAVGQDTSNTTKELKSYERRVLGIHEASMSRTISDVQVPEDSDSDSAGRRENELELPIVIAWQESPGVKWFPGSRHGQLTSKKRPGIALYQDAQLAIANLDFEAKLKVLEGDSAGLVFRAGHMYYFVLTMDLSRQTLDVRQGNMKYHDLKRMSSEVAPMSISADPRKWARLRVTCLGTMISIHFNNEQLGQLVAPKVVVYVVLPRVMNQNSRALPLFEQEGHLLVGHAGEDAFLVYHRDEILEVNGVSDDFAKMKTMCKSCEQLRIKLARIEPGHVGVWCCAQGSVKIRDARLTDLTMYDTSLEHGKQRMQEEEGRRMQEEEVRREQQRVTKVTSVTFAAFDSTGGVIMSPSLSESGSKSQGQPEEQQLEEEDLDKRYARKMARGAEESRKVGQRVLGEAKFEAMRNMEHGPAHQQKLIIAKKYYERALSAVSEVEHKQNLKMAFCLENDYDSHDQIPPDEFQKWLDAKEEGTPSQQPSTSPRGR
mmetsp:Transcript_6942/g.19325  ORF Transcript_6942/g.19325 Transcript_6942/m.19325 type:complete len:670 (-) Transcript_6942:84-2093(-)